jgi:hypothetical protein
VTNAENAVVVGKGYMLKNLDSQPIVFAENVVNLILFNSISYKMSNIFILDILVYNLKKWKMRN